MSCYEWEHGEIKLPTGYSAKLRAHLTVAAEKVVNDLIAETNAAWGRLKTVPPAKRQTAMWEMDLSEAAERLMCTHVRDEKNGAWSVKVSKPNISQIKKSVMDRAYARGAPNGAPKRLTFSLDGNATITFTDTNTVVWDVPENNHTCERANAHPLAQRFFDFLENNVEWTTHSGGQIVGNNEYNREDRSLGGGGTYLVREYSRDAVARRQGRRASFGYERHG